MSPLRVRLATLADAPGIHAIYRADTDGSPWSIADTCAPAIARRLKAGYLTLVAEDANAIVGHADYVIGEEPEPLGKTIHLSVLQVHPEYRGLGAGRALVDHGLALGRKHQCRWLTTQPADDARGFYTACGLHCILQQVEVAIRCACTDRAPWKHITALSPYVPAQLPLRIGRMQSSTDMWHLCESDFGAGFAMQHIRARAADAGALLVLRSIMDPDPHNPPPEPMLIAWAQPSLPLQDILSAASTIAQDAGMKALRCLLPLSDLPSVPDTFSPTIKSHPDFWGIALD